jgi:hypothetical protein
VYVRQGEGFVVDLAPEPLYYTAEKVPWVHEPTHDERQATRDLVKALIMLNSTIEERCSICPHCRTRLLFVVLANWCPSCRTDVKDRDVVLRPYYEHGPRSSTHARRLPINRSVLGSISA